MVFNCSPCMSVTCPLHCIVTALNKWTPVVLVEHSIVIFIQRWRDLANSRSLANTDTGLNVVKVHCYMRRNADCVHILSNHVYTRNEGSIGASLWRAITHKILNTKVYIYASKERAKVGDFETTDQCLSVISTKTIIIAYGPFSQIRSQFVTGGFQ